MAARTVLSFGAGATLFGPLSKYLAEPAAEAWAKATEALPFLQPAGVTLEQSMQRLNDQLDAVLKARSPRDARRPGAPSSSSPARRARARARRPAAAARALSHARALARVSRRAPRSPSLPPRERTSAH